MSTAAVLAAGTPAVYSSAEDLGHTQQLLQDVERGQRALSLSHTLAEERDTLVIAAADGTPSVLRNAADGDGQARVDRRIDELRPDVSGSLREELDTVPQIRAQVRGGTLSAAETYQAYSSLIGGLEQVTRSASRYRPERAVDPVSGALPDLARAVESSAATRTLVVALASGDGTDPQLLSLARHSHAREQAALTDFAALADPESARVYSSTVTGAAVGDAEEQLSALTAAESFAAPEPVELHATLSARTELQRGVLSSLAVEQTRALEQLRNADLTTLQWRVALLAAALLLAAGFGVYTARSLTRPLAAVRLGSRRIADDPAGQLPVRYTGPDDEFATVVTAVNELHARAVELHRQETALAADRGGLQEELEKLRAEQRELVDRLATQTGLMHTTLLYHARRSLDLAGQQLAVVDRLEEHETDPDRLATFFALDHLAARVRRHSENLLLLSGAEITSPPPQPVALVDVALGALSEAARYELVDVDQRLPQVLITQPAARDLGHLLAELLDNATASSPDGARVRVAGSVGHQGITVTVTDDGPGLDEASLAALNTQLAAPAELPPPGSVLAPPSGGTPWPRDDSWPGPGSTGDATGGLGMGLYTVARLAVRHGLRPRLRNRPGGGLLAEVEIPAALVEHAPGALPVPRQTTPPGGIDTRDLAGLAPRETMPPVAPVEVRPLGGIAPDAVLRHDRSAGTGQAPPPPAPTASPPPTTEGGLPIRVRSAGRAPGPGPADHQPPAAPAVDAEELRRRLGGFQRGARDGYRDAQSAGPPAEEEMQ